MVVKKETDVKESDECWSKRSLDKLTFRTKKTKIYVNKLIFQNIDLRGPCEKYSYFIIIYKNNHSKMFLTNKTKTKNH